ncbi:transcriptional regulator [Aeromicrobium sp. A1-2]|uniref:helix-turn-helix transcriptional regulator n=1 Tax=Aeromicrobium sp. A1-2 TaxID=2107713 RepID=UPI000E46F007|nr:helix-turn-helix domain-containing protein [Aeromicrobium sp. A1-2]AXT84283.1 transcriptional regulator [Aeromicrobium sp. A1-2]
MTPDATTETPPRGRRDQVLQVLRDADRALTIVQIAASLGVHPNTARFHLDTLVEVGQAMLVEADRRAPGRPPLMFRFVRRMDPAGPRQYRLLAEVLAQNLAGSPDPAAKAIEAGHAWALSMHSPVAEQPDVADDNPVEGSIGRLVGLLDDLGFAPETSAVGIGLRRCPFIELVEDHSEVICPIHLGLMQGSLAAWSSPVTVERLEPFTEPDLCMAHLTPTKDPR